MINRTIKIEQLSKLYKGKEVVKDVSFEAEAGRVTAFLGPNGAGKSSTLRMLLGLDYQNYGTALFGEKKYSELARPLTVVGALFDGIGGNKSRTVSSYLKIAALSNGIALVRINEVLKEVGLLEKRKQKLGQLSLGESQRLGLALALLGNPQFLVLDEPTNGLDPSGIRWFRHLIRKLADNGKTILLSSHMLSEIESVADDVIIINRGQIVLKGPLGEIKSELSTLEELFFELTEMSTLEEMIK